MSNWIQIFANDFEYNQTFVRICSTEFKYLRTTAKIITQTKVPSEAFCFHMTERQVGGGYVGHEVQVNSALYPGVRQVLCWWVLLKELVHGSCDWPFLSHNSSSWGCKLVILGLFQVSNSCGHSLVGFSLETESSKKYWMLQKITGNCEWLQIIAMDFNNTNWSLLVNYR